VDRRVGRTLTGAEGTSGPRFQVAILTVSDRCAQGEVEDRSGPALADRVTRDLPGDVVRTACVPDEVGAISALLRQWALDDPRPHLLLTTGGTGFAVRDVTPEATLAVLERRAPGLQECIRAQGAEATPFAYLSRGEAGTLAGTLIVNLPGSPKGAMESFEAVLPLLPHALRLMRDARDPHPPSPPDPRV